MAAFFRNPVSYCIYVLTILFVVLSFREPPLLVMQHLLAPYTVDITSGVGETVAEAFRGFVLILQIPMLLLVYGVAKSPSGARRITMIILGIMFAVMYFLTIAIGYVAPRFH